jgi:hypothetical protein
MACKMASDIAVLEKKPACLMGFWTNKDHRSGFDDAEDLAYPPSGGRVKMWVLGIGLAVIPICYGIYCLLTRHAVLFGSREADLDLNGSAAVALAIAYIAVGIFIHAHWFWGLYPKCEPLSYLLKLVAAPLFLASLGYTMYKIVA